MEKRQYSLTVAADEPSKQSLELINAAIAELESIGLEDADGWFRGYVENKPESRLAQDLDVVTERILGQATICEYGAAPFVYTKALDRSDYQGGRNRYSS